MIYITKRLSPKRHNMTIEEFLYDDNAYNGVSSNIYNTYTYKKDDDNFCDEIVVNQMLLLLTRYAEKYKAIREFDRNNLYETFPIPKKSGGLRWINAPKPELMNALRELKAILETNFNADVLYHTNAYAYIKGRSTLDAIKKHQGNNSRWFAKLDLSNFFGSVTMDFLMQMLRQVYPFSMVFNFPGGERILRDAFDLAFLDGVLPQGTPLSPMLTNILMIPIDFELSKELREFNKSSYIYTRYADDFLISSKYNFNINDVVELVESYIQKFNAPLILNKDKTRYGSSAGRNWNLGLMLNKDNEITVGYKRKKLWKSMAHNYIVDKKNGVDWPLEDIQHMDGVRSYIEYIEPDNMRAIIDHINKTHECDLMNMIKSDLSV